MTRKVVIGGIAGGVTLFVWGVVAWMLLPLYQSVLKDLPGEERVVAALRETGTPGGFYVIPGLPRNRERTEEARARSEEEWEQRYRQGPVAVLIYHPRGRPANRMFWPMVRGLSLCFVVGFFAAWTLSRARIRTHVGRVAFVLGLGFFAWLLGPGMQWNLFGFPPEFTLVSLADAVIGWTIVGVVQTGIVRPVLSAAPSAGAGG